MFCGQINKNEDHLVLVFCSKVWFVLYLDYSNGLFQQYCYGQTRLAAGVTGKSRRVGAKGQAKRSGVDPPGEDEGRRRGKWYGRKGQGALTHGDGREKGKGGRRGWGQNSDTLRERGMGERWRKGWGEQGVLLIHLFDLADSLPSQLVLMFKCTHVHMHLCMWRKSLSVFISTLSRLGFICQAGSGQHTQTHKKNLIPLHHREISHLSNLNFNKQMYDQKFGLGDWSKYLWKAHSCVSIIKLTLSLKLYGRKKETCLLVWLIILSVPRNLAALRIFSLH